MANIFTFIADNLKPFFSHLRRATRTLDQKHFTFVQAILSFSENRIERKAAITVDALLEPIDVGRLAASAKIAERICNAASSGHRFIANPGLPERIRIRATENMKPT